EGSLPAVTWERFAWSASWQLSQVRAGSGRGRSEAGTLPDAASWQALHGGARPFTGFLWSKRSAVVWRGKVWSLGTGLLSVPGGIQASGISGSGAAVARAATRARARAIQAKRARFIGAPGHRRGRRRDSVDRRAGWCRAPTPRGSAPRSPA